MKVILLTVTMFLLINSGFSQTNSMKFLTNATEFKLLDIGLSDEDWNIMKNDYLIFKKDSERDAELQLKKEKYEEVVSLRNEALNYIIYGNNTQEDYEKANRKMNKYQNEYAKVALDYLKALYFDKYPEGIFLNSQSNNLNDTSIQLNNIIISGKKPILEMEHSTRFAMEAVPISFGFGDSSFLEIKLISGASSFYKFLIFDFGMQNSSIIYKYYFDKSINSSEFDYMRYPGYFSLYNFSLKVEINLFANKKGQPLTYIDRSSTLKRRSIHIVHSQDYDPVLKLRFLFGPNILQAKKDNPNAEEAKWKLIGDLEFSAKLDLIIAGGFTISAGYNINKHYQMPTVTLGYTIYDGFKRTANLIF